VTLGKPQEEVVLINYPMQTVTGVQLVIFDFFFLQGKPDVFGIAGALYSTTDESLSDIHTEVSIKVSSKPYQASKRGIRLCGTTDISKLKLKFLLSADTVKPVSHVIFNGDFLSKKFLCTNRPRRSSE